MTTQIQKWGNSLAVRLPKDILKKTTLKEGGDVLIESKNGIVTLTSIEKEETLKSLVKKITSENRHKEVSWGKPVGNEIW